MPHYEEFVPTPPELAREKLRLAGVQPGETVFDLGCGDGAPLIIAAREFEARGVGIEVRPELIEESRQAIQTAGLEEQIELRCEDFMDSDFSEADVIFIYLTRGSMGPLSLKLENELSSGTRIVTHTFDLPAWTVEVHTQRPDQQGQLHDLYLYRAP
jgi:predicted O-methyltransferase YrrM